MKGKKNLANIIMGITMVGATLIPNFGQTQNKHINKEKAVVEAESNFQNEGERNSLPLKYNNKTIDYSTLKPSNSSRGKNGFYGDQYLNPFIQPNLLNGGEFDLSYYGSGDVTQNDELNWDDYNSILGSNKDEADINGDGNPGTQADKNLLESYLLDNIPYLPAHFDFQNTLGKESWFENYYNNVDITDEHPPGPNWDCSQYARQFQINTAGVENISASPLDPNIYDTTLNARANIPVYDVNTVYENYVGHGINSILVGDDPQNFNDWYFYEPQTDERVYPGDPSMHEDFHVYITRYVYSWNEIFNQYMHSVKYVIDFDLDNGNASITWQHPYLVVNRPIEQSYIHPGGQIPGDIIVNYEDRTNISVTGEPSGVESWASVYFADSTNQESGNWNPAHYNYDIYRSWRAESDFSPLIDTIYGSINPVYGRSPQLITVQDVTPPTLISGPVDRDLLFSQYIAPEEAIFTDNCGVYDQLREINSTQGTSPNCNYYNFIEVVADSAWDPSSNNTVNIATTIVALDPNQWDNLPNDWTGFFGDNTNPENTGHATSFNPAGVGVNVTYSDVSTQGDAGSCNYYNYEIDRTWVATDEVCDSSIEHMQNLNINLQNNEWDEFPGDVNLNYGDNTSPDSTGWATAFNVSGVGVEVTYGDFSTQGNPGTCDYITYEIERTWTATDIICGTLIDSIQYINITPEENVWDFFPNNWDGIYSQSLNLNPENTGGYAQASNPGGLEVIISYNDESNRSPNQLNCTYYNFWVDRTWTATEEFCNTSISQVQDINVTKPMSLNYLTFPEDYQGDIIDPWDPSVTGEPTGQDTLAPIIPVNYIYTDELIESTPTYDLYHREFELTEYVCGTQTDSDSTQVITLYKGNMVPQKSLEDRLVIYPNPTRGSIKVKYDFEKPQKITTEIYSISGKLTRNFNEEVSAGQEVLEFDISGLNKGLYFMKFSVDGNSFVKKIIKN